MSTAHGLLQFQWGSPLTRLSALIMLGVGLGYGAYRIVYGGQRTSALSITLLGRAVTASGAGRVIPMPQLFTTRYRLRSNVLYVLLGLTHLVFAGGILATVQIGRPRFFGMALVGFSTLLILDAIVFRPFTGVARWITGSDGRLLIIARDQRVAASALLASIAALLVFGRGLVYFSLIALFVTSVALHVYIDDGRTYVLSTLGLLAAGVGLIVASQVFVHGYYLPTLDTVYHTALVRRISDAGSLSAIAGTRYDSLPVFHTFASLHVQITGIVERRLVGLLYVALFSVAVLSGFTIVRNLTGSTKTGLLGAVLLSVNPEFISWATQSHAQTLSFFFLSVFMLLLSKWNQDIRYTFLAVIVTIAWVMTHHLSVFMSVILLAVWVISGSIWILLSDRGNPKIIQRPLSHYAILVVSMSVYWYFSGLIYVPLNWVNEQSVAASSGLPTEQFLIESYSDPVELIAATGPFLLNNIHYAFMIGLCGYCLWTVVQSGGTVPNRAFPGIVVACLFSILLYIPNPTWAIARGVATLARWGIMTLLFLLPVAALGLKRFSKDSLRLPTDSQRFSGAVAVLLIVLLTGFVSVGAGLSDPSLAGAVGQDKETRSVLSQGDLDAGQYVTRYTDDSSVYASHKLSGYLSHETWNGTEAERADRFDVITVVDSEIVRESGLTVVEHESLENDRIKTKVVPADLALYRDNVSVYTPVSTEAVELDTEQRNVVYDNTDTYVSYAPEG